MSKMIYVRLLSTAIIAGVPRSPVEGIQSVSDDEAKRLVDAGQAEYADGDVDQSDSDFDANSDGLDKKNKAALAKIAKDESITLETDANKATMIAAIRKGRSDRDFATTLDGLDEAALRKHAEDAGITLEDDLDEAGIRAAIIDQRPDQITV